MRWFFLEVLFPVGLISMMFWPIGSFTSLGDLPFLYERIFGGADLLPICFLILFGVFNELTGRLAVPSDMEQEGALRLTYLGWWLNLLRWTCALVGITAGGMYTVFKLEFLKYPMPDVAGATLHQRVTEVSNLSIGFTVAAVGIALLCKSLLLIWQTREAP